MQAKTNLIKSVFRSAIILNKTDKQIVLVMSFFDAKQMLCF